MHSMPDGTPNQDVLVGLEETGARLVRALTDQLVDGQVQTLHSLQSAAALLRRHTNQVTDATHGLADAAQNLTQSVADEVARGFGRLLCEALASLGEILHAQVEGSTAALRAAADEHTMAIAKQLSSTEKTLVKLSEGSAQRALNAQQALEWSAAEAAQRLEGAASTLSAQSDASETSFSAVGASLSDLVNALGADLESRIAQGTQLAVDSLRAAVSEGEQHLLAVRDDTTRQIADTVAAADKQLAAMRKQLAAQEKRDEAVAARAQQRLDTLIERTDAAAGANVARLQQVADTLAERDRALERQRAEEFARVLDDVLAKGGGSNRRLRNRIRRSLVSAPPSVGPSEPGSTEAVPAIAGQAPLPVVAPSRAATRAPAASRSLQSRPAVARQNAGASRALAKAPTSRPSKKAATPTKAPKKTTSPAPHEEKA